MPTSSPTSSIAFGSRGLGRGLARLARVLGLQLLQADVHVELRHALAAHGHRLDLDQVGVFEVRRRGEVAHESGHARVGLRVAHHVDFQPSLLDRPEIHAIERLQADRAQAVYLLQELVQQMPDDLLARKQGRDLGLKLLYLLDLLVEPDVFLLQEFVATALLGNVPGDSQVHRAHDQKPEERHHPSQHAEMLALGFAARFAPREQVDAVHGSNLRIASPQATISEGASATSFFSCTREEIAMLAKGLATRVLICVRLCTISSSPGITAEPPVSRTCSTEVY